LKKAQVAPAHSASAISTPPWSRPPVVPSDSGPGCRVPARRAEPSAGAPAGHDLTGDGGDGHDRVHDGEGHLRAGVDVLANTRIIEAAVMTAVPVTQRARPRRNRRWLTQRPMAPMTSQATDATMTEPPESTPNRRVRRPPHPERA
jgi:hypothetical protein